MKNAFTTERIQKASKPDLSKVRKCLDSMELQEGHLEHNEIVIGKEIGSQDLLLATPELAGVTLQ